MGFVDQKLHIWVLGHSSPQKGLIGLRFSSCRVRATCWVCFFTFGDLGVSQGGSTFEKGFGTKGTAKEDIV